MDQLQRLPSTSFTNFERNCSPKKNAYLSRLKQPANAAVYRFPVSSSKYISLSFARFRRECTCLKIQVVLKYKFTIFPSVHSFPNYIYFVSQFRTCHRGPIRPVMPPSARKISHKCVTFCGLAFSKVVKKRLVQCWKIKLEPTTLIAWSPCDAKWFLFMGTNVLPMFIIWPEFRPNMVGTRF
jgi:hypothetical protein